MRYTAALVAALALGAGASLYTPKADAGVVVSVGLPVPVVAPPVAYYPYAPVPLVGLGVGFNPVFFRHGYCRPEFRGPVPVHPGLVPGGYVHGGFIHGSYFHSGYRFHR